MNRFSPTFGGVTGPCFGEEGGHVEEETCIGRRSHALFLCVLVRCGRVDVYRGFGFHGGDGTWTRDEAFLVDFNQPL